MRARLYRTSDGRLDQLDVPLDVAHGRVHLDQRDAQLGHACSLFPGPPPPELAQHLEHLVVAPGPHLTPQLRLDPGDLLQSLPDGLVSEWRAPHEPHPPVVRVALAPGQAVS